MLNAGIGHPVLVVVKSTSLMVFRAYQIEHTRDLSQQCRSPDLSRDWAPLSPMQPSVG